MGGWGHRPLSYRLDDDGVPVPCDDPLELARWRARMWSHPDVRIAEDVVDDVRVSTVFVGFDPVVSGPPVLWETAIFCEARETMMFARYSSKADAIAGHAAALELARANPYYFWWV